MLKLQNCSTNRNSMMLQKQSTSLKRWILPNSTKPLKLAVNLNVDPKYADQQVRGALVLPHGIGKSKTVLVFAQGDKEKEAQAAGADYVGADDLIEKIKGGWLDFDVAIATPNMMGKVGRLGKILGPKGLMPNPKVGTVTMDVTKAVSESKAGKVEYRTDKAGNIHSPIGKKSFDADKLVENLTTLVDTLIKVKPSGAKWPVYQIHHRKLHDGPWHPHQPVQHQRCCKKEEN